MRERERERKILFFSFFFFTVGQPRRWLMFPFHARESCEMDGFGFHEEDAMFFLTFFFAHDIYISIYSSICIHPSKKDSNFFFFFFVSFFFFFSDAGFFNVRIDLCASSACRVSFRSRTPRPLHTIPNMRFSARVGNSKVIYLECEDLDPCDGRQNPP